MSVLETVNQATTLTFAPLKYIVRQNICHLYSMVYYYMNELPTIYDAHKEHNSIYSKSGFCIETFLSYTICTSFFLSFWITFFFGSIHISCADQEL